MLDPREEAEFQGLVAQLRTVDPRFSRRVDRLPRRFTALAVALWCVAPLCIVFGGWTGAVVAVICCAYGIRLYRRRKPQPAFWVARSARPSARP